MSRWPCVPKPAPGSTRSSLMTRSARNPMCRGSWYSPNENVCRLSSQPQSVRPRSLAARTVTVPAAPAGGVVRLDMSAPQSLNFTVAEGAST
jgi:hypothetical protein